MGNNNCTCCCAHGNAQPDKQPEHTGFLKEYGRILLSAALLFSDGRYAGGMLDRNGLRPARYLVTNDGYLILAVLVDDDRLTPEEQAALAALNGARPSSRHDLIGAAWGVYAQRDPDRARRRERRAAASQHHTVDADENPTTKTSGN